MTNRSMALVDASESQALKLEGSSSPAAVACASVGPREPVRFETATRPAGAAAFHLYAAGFSPFTALVQRPVHLAFMAVLGFLGMGLVASDDEEDTRTEEPGSPSWVGIILAVLTVLVCAYLASQNQELVRRSGSPTTLDLVAGALAIVLVLELARRTTGWGLVAVCGLALTYGAETPEFPGYITGMTSATGPDGTLSILRAPNNGFPAIVRPGDSFDAVL